MRVLTKSACYIEGVWHAPNTEIEIDEKHFAEETHTPLDKPATVEEEPASEEDSE
jgi:hypothetical protein